MLLLEESKEFLPLNNTRHETTNDEIKGEKWRERTRKSNTNKKKETGIGALVFEAVTTSLPAEEHKNALRYTELNYFKLDTNFLQI